MGSQFIALLVTVATAGVLCGFVASRVARGKKQRARRFFAAGLVCGFAAGVVVRRRWPEIGRLAIRTLRSTAAPRLRRLNRSSPPHRRRRTALLTVRR
jgi:hypothetical protein